MVSLGRLVAGVAHELNNPISFVLGNVLSLQRYASRLESYLGAVHATSVADDAALIELRQSLRIDRILADMPLLIDGMIEGAERTRDIVDALKRFSAVDKTLPEQVCLNDVIERSVRWVVQSASARFAVDVDLPPDLRCSGSSGQLQAGCDEFDTECLRRNAPCRRCPSAHSRLGCFGPALLDIQ